jgi:hypothetical protein
MSVTDEHRHRPETIVSSRLKAPLLAKNARNGAPNLLRGYFGMGDVGDPRASTKEKNDQVNNDDGKND